MTFHQEATTNEKDHLIIGTAFFYQEDMRKMTGPPGLLFPAVLYKILKESTKFGHEHIISWLPNGRAFKIHDRDEFVEKVLPKYYPSSSSSTTTTTTTTTSSSSSSLTSSLSPGDALDDFDDENTTTSSSSNIGDSSNDNNSSSSNEEPTATTTTSDATTTATKTTTTTKQKQFKWKSFLRQINLYGFERITKKSRQENKKLIDKNEVGAYTHKFFRRDDESLCCLIQRKDGKSKCRFPHQLVPQKKSPAVSPVALLAAKMSPAVVVSSIKKKVEYKNNIILKNSKAAFLKSYDDAAVAANGGGIRRKNEVSGKEEMQFSTSMTKRGGTERRFDSYDHHHSKETDCTDSSPIESPFLVPIEIAEEGGQRRGTEKACNHSVGCGNQLSSTTVTSMPSPSSSFCPSQETSSHHSTHEEEPSSSWELSHHEHNDNPDGFDFWNTKEEDNKLEENHHQMDYFSERDIVDTTATPTTTVGTFSNTILDTTSSVNESNMILPFDNEGASTTSVIVPTIFPFACTTHAAAVSPPTFYNQQMNDALCIGSNTGVLGSNIQDPMTTNTNTILDVATNRQFLPPCHHQRTISCTSDDNICDDNNTIASSNNGGEQHKTMKEMLIENESLLSVLFPGIRVSSSSSAVDTKQEMYPFYCSRPKQMVQVSNNNIHQGIREEDKVLYSPLPPATAAQAELRGTLLSPNLPSPSYDWEDYSTKFKNSASTCSSAMAGLGREYDFGWDKEANHGYGERSNFIHETIGMLADILEPDPI